MQVLSRLFSWAILPSDLGVKMNQASAWPEFLPEAYIVWARVSLLGCRETFGIKLLHDSRFWLFSATVCSLLGCPAKAGSSSQGEGLPKGGLDASGRQSCWAAKIKKSEVEHGARGSRL